MTTIAITKDHIAADGQRTWGDQIRGLNFKKLRVEPGKRIYAFTGSAPMLDVMVKWHKDGADPKSLPEGHKTEGGWTLIVIDQEGVGKYTDGCPYIERFDPPIAFGAGLEYAMGAMLVGASAAEAVAAVASLTNHTGGEIQVVNIADALNPRQAVRDEKTGITKLVVAQ